MTHYVEQIAKAVMGAYEYLNQIHLLEAVWRLDHPTWVVEPDYTHKRTVRFTRGQMIAVDVNKVFPHIDVDGVEKLFIDGKIKDCKEGDKPSHRILATFGASNHSFSFKLECLVTANHYYIKL